MEKYKGTAIQKEIEVLCGNCKGSFITVACIHGTLEDFLCPYCGIRNIVNTAVSK